jgi:hypothetical protein
MAVVEVPKVKVEKIGLKPFHEFDAANETWPRGDRPAAIREAAAEFRARFATPENRVRGVRTIDIGAAGYPVKSARIPTSTSSTGYSSSSSRTSTAG